MSSFEPRPPSTRNHLLFLAAILVVAFYFLMIASGCQTAPSPTLAMSASDTIKKYDLTGTINGTPFEGIGVVPRAGKYVLRIESREDVDLMTITSCHREKPAEAVIQAGWFKQNRGYEYVYEPAPGLEDVGSCLLRIGTYNGKVKGLNAHAVIDFQTPGEELPSWNVCNGANGRTAGVSMCQSKVGLVQRLQFDGPTRALTTDPKAASAFGGERLCSGKWLSTKLFEYEIAAGECVIAFMEEREPHRVHRHTVIGYTKVPIRTTGGQL